MKLSGIGPQMVLSVKLIVPSEFDLPHNRTKALRGCSQAVPVPFKFKMFDSDL